MLLFSLFQSSTAGPNFMEISSQSPPLNQPAVITATSQPAANATANQKKLPNRSEQALHNSISCVAVNAMRYHLLYEPLLMWLYWLPVLQRRRMSLTCLPRRGEAPWLIRGRGEKSLTHMWARVCQALSACTLRNSIWPAIPAKIISVSLSIMLFLRSLYYQYAYLCESLIVI